MACNNCYNSSCDSTCGCPQQVKGTCVFYQGANLDCLDVTKGDDYDSILANLNTLICDIVAPSGNTTVVTSNACSGGNNILVTSSTVGSTTTYNVCLNPTLVTQINNNTSNIAGLSACVSGLVSNITTSTPGLTITPGSPTTCGRPFTIDYTPTPVDTVDGIVESNNTKSNYTNTCGLKVLKTSTFNNFVSNSALTNGDEIRFRLTGQIAGDGSNVDTVTIQLFNASTALPISDKEIKGFDLTNRQSWVAEGVITVTDVVNGDGIYTLTFFSNSLANGGFAIPNSNSKIVVSEDISGIDYDNLLIKVIYNHLSTTSDATNFARQLMIEVRKKI